MGRFQNRGGIQTTTVNGEGPVSPSSGDVAFAIGQQTGFDACNAQIQAVAYFLPNNNPDVAKTENVQRLLQGVYTYTSVASLTAAGVSGQGVQCYAGLVDWQATLLARTAALKTY